jgi:hypothetical protein
MKRSILVDRCDAVAFSAQQFVYKICHCHTAVARQAEPAENTQCAATALRPHSLATQ